jgi:hypothetical protein
MRASRSIRGEHRDRGIFGSGTGDELLAVDTMPRPRLRKPVRNRHGRATVSGEPRRTTVFGWEGATDMAGSREVRILERALTTPHLA